VEIFLILIISIGSCGITTSKSTTLTATGSTLPNDLKNVMINCSCNGGHDDKVYWFSPVGTRMYDYYYTSNTKPYTVQGSHRMSSMLLFPKFGYLFAGAYTCGIGSSFPPNIMAVTDLSKS